MFLLLTLNIFYTFGVSIVDFEEVNISRVIIYGCLGYPALGPSRHIRPSALIKFSTSSTSSYLKSSHYDHVHISFNGLRVFKTMLTYSCYILTSDNSFWTRSYGGSYKITIVCLSVRQFGIFLRNWSIEFL